LNEIIIKWNQIYTKGITLSTNSKINSVLFGDDRVIVADSGDNLQRGVFTVQDMANIYEMEISPEKSETMSFLGQDPVRCKIIVDNMFTTSK